jgi:outer membrane immunogenic protein
MEGAMIYATAGGAWLGINETDSFVVTGAPAFVGTSSNTKSGYSVGGGIEMRLWANWTAKVEYLHIDVSGISTVIPLTTVLPATLTTTTNRIRDDIVRIGLNWKFGGFGGVVAAY